MVTFLSEKRSPSVAKMILNILPCPISDLDQISPEITLFVKDVHNYSIFEATVQNGVTIQGIFMHILYILVTQRRPRERSGRFSVEGSHKFKHYKTVRSRNAPAAAYVWPEQQSF